VKIPSDAVIADEKLTQYLLEPKLRNDKSRFLAGIGFTQDNPEKLKAAIRMLADDAEATEEKKTEYGTSYQVAGILNGTNERKVLVILVWFQRSVDERFYFVTLKPDKEGIE
jgi:Domain of unknown function (DUF6883)